MKHSLWLSFTLLLFSLYGGGVVIEERLRLLEWWRHLPVAKREGAILGPLAPLVANVCQHVSPNEGLLLFSPLDPALIPYVLFPRKIWQIQVEPESNAFYMQLPPSPFPRRRPEDFPAVWRLNYMPDNASQGGDLVKATREPAHLDARW